MEPTINKFEGWAIVEMFGHAKAIGFVTTQVFGQAVLFRVDSPELAEREFTLKIPAYVEDAEGTRTWTPRGAKVRRPIIPASSRLVGPGAIYSIVPCTEETARAAIEDLVPRPLILLEPPKAPEPMKITWPSETLPGEPVEHAASEAALDLPCDECGGTPEEGHSENCSFAEVDDDGDPS